MLSGRNISVRYLHGARQRPVPFERTTAALLLGGITGFQVALAAGAPWGSLAWGGSHDGVLPDRLRAASGVAAAGWGVATVVVAAELPRSATGQRLVLRGVGVLCAAGAVLNLVSPSPAERALWAPVSAAVAALAWRAARTEAVTDGSAGRVA